MLKELNTNLTNIVFNYYKHWQNVLKNDNIDNYYKKMIITKLPDDTQ